MGASSLLGSLLPVWPRRVLADPRLPSLKALASEKGLHFGSDSDVAIAAAPEPYADLFRSQCELIAVNLSWAYITSKDGPDRVREDPNIGFAAANRLPLTGAHLLWHESIPPWFDHLTTAAEARRAAAAHIRAMAKHYSSRTFSWNVVNEALRPSDGRPDGLRQSTLLDRLGPDYIDWAFRVAREADPGSLLAYNDYGLEMDRPDHEAKRAALLKLLERLKRQDTPISAVGLQSHLKLDGSQFNATLYRSFLKTIASFGYKILVTELDVLDTGAPADFAARDQAVADLYSRFLDAALDERSVISLVTWGLSDRYTWLTPASGRDFARPDELPTRPLPFDADFKPKPAFAALVNALKHAPAR